MTAAEWLAETGSSQWLMNHLGDTGVSRTKAGRRRLRLFACGCCRVVWDVLPDERLREAVRVAERFADGAATKDELAAARAAVEGLDADSAHRHGTPTTVRVAIDMAVVAAHPQPKNAASCMTASVAPLAGAAGGEATLCHLLRCLFPNPFRPPAFDGRWRTSSAVGLAAGIYAERAFDRLPILADSLEDAGCADADVLGHCRSAGPHARGCWVVDGVLGK